MLKYRFSFFLAFLVLHLLFEYSILTNYSGGFLLLLIFILVTVE